MRRKLRTRATPAQGPCARLCLTAQDVVEHLLAPRQDRRGGRHYRARSSHCAPASPRERCARTRACEKPGGEGVCSSEDENPCPWTSGTCRGPPTREELCGERSYASAKRAPEVRRFSPMDPGFTAARKRRGCCAAPEHRWGHRAPARPVVARASARDHVPVPVDRVGRRNRLTGKSRLISQSAAPVSSWRALHRRLTSPANTRPPPVAAALRRTRLRCLEGTTALRPGTSGLTRPFVSLL